MPIDTNRHDNLYENSLTKYWVTMKIYGCKIQFLIDPQHPMDLSSHTWKLRQQW